MKFFTCVCVCVCVCVWRGGGGGEGVGCESSKQNIVDTKLFHSV